MEEEATQALDPVGDKLVSTEATACLWMGCLESVEWNSGME